MRIGLETLSCDSTTGIGKIVRALAESFVTRGHEVHIFSDDPGGLDGRLHIHRVPGFPGSKGLSKVLFRLGEHHRIRGAGCDVIYSFGVGRCADVVAAQSCHRAGMEALKAYDMKPWDGTNLGLYDRVSLHDEMALLTSERTGRIIACSESVRKDIIHYYGVDPDRIVVIPNGIWPSRPRNNPEISSEIRARFGVEEDERVLLFVGNEFGRKGLRTVIEAMAKLPFENVRLLVAGNGNIKPYEQLAAGLHLAGKVSFLGAAPNTDELFGVADLFVFPTLYEPFGMVVLEAMAAGVPVITSRLCGAVEGMTHGVQGIFVDDPTSAASLAEWMELLLGKKEVHRQIAAAAREKASEFSWDSIAEKTLGVLQLARTKSRHV